jgi:hypothetical protein
MTLALRRVAMVGAAVLFVAAVSTAVPTVPHALASTGPTGPTGPTEPMLVRATGAKSDAAPQATARAATCPQPGQRVKSPSSPAVYLVDPDFFLNLIPNETVYFSLWDTWNGISTVSDATLVECFGFYFTVDGAHLAKLANDPHVYIYDANGGGYRWITSETIFNKYWDVRAAKDPGRSYNRSRATTCSRTFHDPGSPTGYSPAQSAAIPQTASDLPQCRNRISGSAVLCGLAWVGWPPWVASR